MRNLIWVVVLVGGEMFEDYVVEGIEKVWFSFENYLEFCKGLEIKFFSCFGGIFKGSDKNDII